ncbi:membrane protein [Xenorhabdus ishibashii]|uniref:Membrane protein n=2 Tax=Xenorhabdus ishibashii TaxID=1034471 RepID=A0A2D0KEN8_9GAMM|nr:membrane protein [Xenorhabdus ishibashii]
MAIYELAQDSLIKVEMTSFEAEKLKERQDIQRFLKSQIEAISPDTLVIAEEYSHFVGSNRRLDLLGIDKSANLVVIELKRDDDGGHMELQAIRYAAMVSNLTWEQAVSAYREFLSQTGQDIDAESSLLDFLAWDSPQHSDFAKETRIVLAASSFSKEITTSVLWMNDIGMDITCVRLQPFRVNGKLLLNIEQIVPLPEAMDYQIEVRHKKREKRVASNEKDHSSLNLYVNGIPYQQGFRKSDIGFYTVKALEEHQLIDESGFSYLRNNKTCSFQLLKKYEEIKGTEDKYKKYRTQLCLTTSGGSGSSNSPTRRNRLE